MKQKLTLEQFDRFAVLVLEMYAIAATCKARANGSSEYSPEDLKRLDVACTATFTYSDSIGIAPSAAGRLAHEIHHDGPTAVRLRLSIR